MRERKLDFGTKTARRGSFFIVGGISVQKKPMQKKRAMEGAPEL
jgi:hypothetical protein